MIKSFLLICLCISSLFAHKLSVFTNMEDNELYVSTYFGNGKPCKSCKVKLISMDNKEIKQLKVNEKGEITYSTKLDKFLLRVDAGSGHVETRIIINEKLQEEQKKVKQVKDLEFEKLQKENKLLKAQIKSLEQKLDYLEIFKVLFGLLIIFVIFFILKKVKK